MTVKEKLAVHAAEVEKYLSECLKGQGIPYGLLESMDYSLLAGGKRLRPVLVLVWAQMLGAKKEAVMPFAASLEMIHTYSLIHDDLPAMDDDDLRRGKPSNHKKFGEATAILAGDGLLTEAFGFMAKADAPAEVVVEAISLMAHSAGACGMVGGQTVDMEYTGRDGITLDELKVMHAMKTGALILSACKSGAILAKGVGATEEDVRRAEEYGRLIGVAFQIVDDVLDVVGDEASLGKPVGSDEEQGKSTYPSLIGLEESKELARKYVDEAVELLAPYSGAEAELLSELAQYIVDRVY
ncbi:geranylgeranyl diphosphate synthase, type II [Maridesulfovibrio ferrireducens]|jgi:geranylgeranyl diphosphate synthase type II|uniref:Geranylgeranyl diphosphate synthase, type II n=1 Tax=Maridesulfovibrio ferrireducens TaxID=246191 RepID=A0A1G9G5K1_9BACT|nr:farnesyl diphosphate synthase [Maridesulfovibrio ferrireducens]SDK95856.1 geranylgeranyl diphosphate synthase, type II [Maridesulfovibrio ferrireducens]